MAETAGRTAPGAGPTKKDYGRGARVLFVGVASTGLFTFAYFALASNLLPAGQYGTITLLWALLFIVISVIYRPVEQLLSRTISDRRARGAHHGHPLRRPIALQAGFAAAFLACALAFSGPLTNLFGGSRALFWIFTGAGLAYAASYFARGYFAGHQWFALYGGLMLFESTFRFCFPLAAAIGITTGQTAIAAGILAAPVLSLLVVPWAIARHAQLDRDAPLPDLTGAVEAGTAFAISVAGIQLGEQILLNSGVLVADAVADAAVAGAVFNVLLITRAPIQLFQSVQTSLLPHLTGLKATEGHDEFGSAISITVKAVAAFAGLAAIGLLIIGPEFMNLVFGDDISYGRVGLAIVAVGMGFHLMAGTLNQAALARERARQAAFAWLLSGLALVGWMFVPAVSDVLLRAEIGYAACAALLCALLYALYRRDAV
jgi:O-antigen/teichoic acid export membrane protein